MRGWRIARTSIAIAALAGAAMATPFARDAMIRGTAVDPLLMGPVETFADDKGIQRILEPLSDKCAAGTPNRVRMFSSSCMTQHLLEIDLDNGEVALRTGYEGEFRSADGKLVRERWRLSPATAGSMREKVAARLPGLDFEAGKYSLPGSEEVIEACIGGQPMMALRHGHTEDGFFELYHELVDGTGLELASSQPRVCI